MGIILIKKKSSSISYFYKDRHLIQWKTNRNSSDIWVGTKERLLSIILFDMKNIVKGVVVEEHSGTKDGLLIEIMYLSTKQPKAVWRYSWAWSIPIAWRSQRLLSAGWQVMSFGNVGNLMEQRLTIFADSLVSQIHCRANGDSNSLLTLPARRGTKSWFWPGQEWRSNDGTCVTWAGATVHYPLFHKFDTIAPSRRIIDGLDPK